MLLSVGTLRLPLMALGFVGLVLPGLPQLLEEESPHACVCPLDADGACECVACNLLEIHGPRVHRERPLGPALSSCTERPGRTAAQVSFEPALLAEPSPSVIRPSWVPSAVSPIGPAPPVPVLARIERPPRECACLAGHRSA